MILEFVNFRKDNLDEHLLDFELAYNSSVNNHNYVLPFSPKLPHSPKNNSY